MRTPHPSSTDYHAQYWASALQLKGPQDDVPGITRSLGGARVDLNPHQIDAALFALRSPYAKGVLLADEVGLGKTIEAGIVLAQKWAERRRRILLVAPASLRKQWQGELASKFFLPSQILDTKTYNDLKKQGVARPFALKDKVVIVSYEFAYTRAEEIRAVDWQLVVLDEAHRLRSIYKETKKAVRIAEAIKPAPKVMLTATPLQNTLQELYGLVSILDPNLFGSLDAFSAQFVKPDDDPSRIDRLRDRIARVCHRTLRRQVLEYVRFTRREPLTLNFTPSEEEQRLHERVTAYLQRPVLVALPSRQRKLIQMVLWKLLASSSRAIGATLTKFVDRLAQLQGGDTGDLAEVLAQDYESLPETVEEWEGDGEEEGANVQHAFGRNDPALNAELVELRDTIALSAKIGEDAKTQKLLEGLAQAFARMSEKGAPSKAVIFTESVKTQEYLVEWLSRRGYEGRIVVMNGTHNDAHSKAIYAQWKARHGDQWSTVTSGSRSADMKAAVVEEFRSDRAQLLIATESAAEGINLQFCPIVVNYDLPWNPQRVEQRIGRCHRYGQEHDVLVLNFVNQKNEADQRVYELLTEKFHLFSGVFGATDDVLGVLENGVDIERAIADIVQRCRTREEIRAAFDALQAEVDEKLQSTMAETRRKVLDHLDEEVQARLAVYRDKARESLNTSARWLLSLCRHALRDEAEFDPDGEARFSLTRDGVTRRYNLRWPQAEERGEEFLRPQSDLTESLIQQVMRTALPVRRVRFVYRNEVSALGPWQGRGGWLRLSLFSTETPDREESALVVSALDDEGTPLDEAVALRFFQLDATVDEAELAEAIPEALGALEVQRRQAVHDDFARRSEQFLFEEDAKLDARVDDIRTSLEGEIKLLDREATALRRLSKTAKALDEKLAAQKKLRETERARDDKHALLYTELKKYRDERDAYIASLEGLIKGRREDFRPLFTLRWELV